MKILINPGHGGKDPGKVSANGNKEAEINKLVADHLQDLLYNKEEFDVLLFQQKNSVNEVTNVANKNNVDLVVSIHCNSAIDPMANGTETLYYKGSKKGKKVAAIVQKELIKAFKLRDRGIKESDKLAVLKYTKAPAIIAELAFLSNSSEERLLLSKSKDFAIAIYKAIKIIATEKLII